LREIPNITQLLNDTSQGASFYIALRDFPADIRHGRESLPGTYTLAYSASSSMTRCFQIVDLNVESNIVMFPLTQTSFRNLADSPLRLILTHAAITDKVRSRPSIISFIAPINIKFNNNDTTTIHIKTLLVKTLFITLINVTLHVCFSFK